MKNTVSKLAMAVVLASGLAGGLVAPVLADVDVKVSVNKTKDIGVFPAEINENENLQQGTGNPLAATLTESISITKIVNIKVNVGLDGGKDANGNFLADTPLILESAAEAQAIANMRSTRNNLFLNGDEGAQNPVGGIQIDIDPDGLLDGSLFFAEILDSVLGNSGIVGVNQNAGTFANQGNLVAAGVVGNGDAFANAQAEADQINSDNTFHEGKPGATPILDASGDLIFPGNPEGLNTFTAIITGSINDTDGIGIVGVNQNAGNSSNQLNAVAIAAGLAVDGNIDELGATVALAEAALGQVNGDDPATIDASTEPGIQPADEGNVVTEESTLKTATILSSLNGNSGGVIGVNQAAGNNVNQGNLVSIAAFVQ